MAKAANANGRPDVLKATSRAYRRTRSGLKAFWRRHANWLGYGWDGLTSATSTSYNVLVKVPWVIAIAIIGFIVVNGLTQQTIVIDPISVPDALAKEGYTPEVAARRLRDALQSYMGQAASVVKGPGIAMHGELPNIVVPSVGISLDAVVVSMRTLFRSTRSRTLSGELVGKDQYTLQLRLDGRTLARVNNAGSPDAIFSAAAESVISEIWPYLEAAKLQRQNESQAALRKAFEIIVKLPPNDTNVVAAHNLIGRIYFGDNKFPAARKEFELALKLDKRFATAQFNLGYMYELGYMREQKGEGGKEDVKPRTKEQITEDQKNAIGAYRAAIRLDPALAVAHYRLARLLTGAKEREREYREAIKYNQSYADAYTGLAGVLAGFKEEDVPGTTEQNQAALRLAAKFAPDLAQFKVDNGAPDVIAGPSALSPPGPGL